MKIRKMFIKDLNFKVDFSRFAEKHFCKSFFKKYKGQWLPTRETIKLNLQRSYQMYQQTNLIDNIKFSRETGIGIFKLDFRVAGTNISPKASGNRTIFALNNNTSLIEVLIVYGKDHCPKKQSETQWILECVKDNFPEYKKCC